MSTFRFSAGWLSVLWWSLAVSGSHAADANGDAPLKIQPDEPWSAIFGGRETKLHFSVSSAAKAETRAAWKLAVDGRVVARRELAVALEANNPAHVLVQFDLPQSRPGIVLPIDLSLTVQAGADEASLDKRLWIFPEDPFALEQQWLAELKVVLFDPRGETSRIFGAAKIPFTEVRRADRLADIDEGILVVGEGVSWSEQRSLPGLAVKLAAKGVPVLALAPSAGVLPFPGSDAADAAPASSVLLRRAEVITQLDKRLDGAGWPPDGKLQVAGVQLAAERSKVVGRFVEGASGWPWLECEFPVPRGRLVVCGFAVIERWDAGPAPRYFFAQVLKRLATDASAVAGAEPAAARSAGANVGGHAPGAER